MNLEQLSFLEVGLEKYVLTPYMITFIDSTLDLMTKSEYMKQICIFYKDLLQKNYQQIGIGKTQRQQLSIESNASDEDDSPKSPQSHNPNANSPTKTQE